MKKKKEITDVEKAEETWKNTAARLDQQNVFYKDLSKFLDIVVETNKHLSWLERRLIDARRVQEFYCQELWKEEF